MNRSLSKDKKDSPQQQKKFIPFVNNFCPRRSLDTSRFYNYFLANDWHPTNSIEKADLVFIYSCGCFVSSEKRTLNTLKIALEKKQPHTKIIVTGCLIKINREVLNGNYNVFPIEEINVLDDIIGARKKLETIPDANSIYPMKDLISPREFLIKKFKMDVEFSSLFYKKVKSLFFGRTKYKKTWNIKIANGCLGNCSYCAVRIAAGKVKSKEPDAIIREFEQGVDRGEKTFVLINNDVGSYGQDIGTNFAELLKQIFAIRGQYQIRIIDFNPRWLIQYYDTLLPLLKKHKEKIAYLSMPVQSGSDRILRLMRRPYQISDIKACFNDLKKNIPEITINTHFIVGFPTETDEDFEKTREFAGSFDFGRISIHPYNDRPGTESSKIPEKVSGQTIFRRYRALLPL